MPRSSVSQLSLRRPVLAPQVLCSSGLGKHTPTLVPWGGVNRFGFAFGVPGAGSRVSTTRTGNRVGVLYGAMCATLLAVALGGERGPAGGGHLAHLHPYSNLGTSLWYRFFSGLFVVCFVTSSG